MTTAASIDPGFCADAFSLTPDPRRLFLSRDHAEALAGLKVGLEYRRGLMVVVGEVGMGKTTVAYSLLDMLRDEVRTAYIGNTRLPFDALLRHALDDFSVECSERDRAGLLSALHAFLLECAALGRTAVLVIDEAQSLDDETFENLRLLSNVETYRQKLLQIILLGQPELDARLRRPHLRQIADRVAVRVNINPFDRAESHRYIEHRLGAAGGSVALFSPAALRLIVRRARGVPRRMNILCHNALLLAYAAGAEQVTRRMVREAVREAMGGTLVRLRSRQFPGAIIPEERRRRIRWWAAAGAAVGTGGLLLAIGSGRPAMTTADAGEGAVPTVAPQLTAQSIGDREVGKVVERIGPVVETPEDEAPEDEAPSAPAVATRPMSDEPATPEQEPRDHRKISGVRVHPGATLMGIARRFYGDGSPQLIRKIMEVNPGIIDPDLILAGSTLVLPPTGRTADGSASLTTDEQGGS